MWQSIPKKRVKEEMKGGNRTDKNNNNFLQLGSASVTFITLAFSTEGLQLDSWWRQPFSLDYKLSFIYLNHQREAEPISKQHHLAEEKEDKIKSKD